MKKYKISIRAQSFEIGDFEKARQKVKELLDAGLWFLDLDEIKEEKKEIETIDSEKGIEQRDQAREKMLKKAKKEKKKPGPKKGTKRAPKPERKKPGPGLGTKYKKKFTPEVDKYIKDHTDKSNEDIVESLKRLFDVNTTSGSVANRRSIIRASYKKYPTKYPEELKDFLIENINEMKNQELLETANKKFDLDLNLNRIKSYLKYNNIKRSKEGRKKGTGKPRTYTDEILQFLRENVNNFKNKELCEELESRFNIKTNPTKLSQILCNKKIKRDIQSGGNSEIGDFVQKSKIKDPYVLRDKIIEKFGKNISIIKLRDLMEKRTKGLPGESVEDEVKRIEQNRDALDDDIDELGLDG